ncbi:Asp23/Gls24 family envelope stress response protein [Streptomyces hypolithicus]
MTAKTGRTGRAQLEGAAAAAALAVPGVAYLRPGLADVLRGAAAQRLGGAESGAGAGAGAGSRSGSGSGGVRARVAEGAGAAWLIKVQLAVVRGHRALDVTRAVRTAVEAAAVTVTGGGAPRAVAVRVTVTGIV